MPGSVPQERALLSGLDRRPNLGVDEPAEMPDVVRGDRDDIASTDRKEGLSRKDGVSLERLVRRGGLAASPDDCPQLGSAVERGLRYRVEFEPHPDRVEPTEARDLAGSVRDAVHSRRSPARPPAPSPPKGHELTAGIPRLPASP